MSNQFNNSITLAVDNVSGCSDDHIYNMMGLFGEVEYVYYYYNINRKLQVCKIAYGVYKELNDSTNILKNIKKGQKATFKPRGSNTSYNVSIE